MQLCSLEAARGHEHSKRGVEACTQLRQCHVTCHAGLVQARGDLLLEVDTLQADLGRHAAGVQSEHARALKQSRRIRCLIQC